MDREIEINLLWAMSEIVDFASDVDDEFDDAIWSGASLRYDRKEIQANCLDFKDKDELVRYLDDCVSDDLNLETLQEESGNDTLIASFRCEGYIYEMLYYYIAYGVNRNQVADQIYNKFEMELGKIGLWFDWGEGTLQIYANSENEES